jgi:hypothetical protein
MKKKKRQAALLILLIIFVVLGRYHSRDLHDFFTDWDNNISAIADICYLVRTQLGIRGIHWSAGHGYEGAVGRLLETRPELANARDYLGRTPLMLAAAGGWDRAVWTLFEHGAKVTSRDLLGRDAFDYLNNNKDRIRPQPFANIKAELQQWRLRLISCEYTRLEGAAKSGNLFRLKAAWSKVPAEFRAEVLNLNPKYYPNL